MEPAVRNALEKRLVEEVQIMLTAGDRPYVEGLSREALLDVLENELRFVGLYAYGDGETQHVVHRILEEYLDEWYRQVKAAQGVEKSCMHPPIPDRQVRILASPGGSIVEITSMGIATQHAAIHYDDFLLPRESFRLQGGGATAEVVTR